MPRIRLLPDQLTADLRIVCSHCRHEFVRDQAWLQRNSHALSCPKCGRLFAKSYEEIMRLRGRGHQGHTERSSNPRSGPVLPE